MMSLGKLSLLTIAPLTDVAACVGNLKDQQRPAESGDGVALKVDEGVRSVGQLRGDTRKRSFRARY